MAENRNPSGKADRYGICLLGLMNTDLLHQELGDDRTACVHVRNALRTDLTRRGYARESSRGALVAEDPLRFRDEIQAGSTLESLVLLVDLCSTEPWSGVEGQPRANARAREQFLSQLSLDLPGDTDEDDPESIDKLIRKGRKLFDIGRAKWALLLLPVVAGGPVGVIAETLAAAAALGAGAGLIVGGGQVALLLRQTPELAVFAAVKRYALIRMLQEYPELELAVEEHLAELLAAASVSWASARRAGDKHERKALDHMTKAFDRVYNELVPGFSKDEEERRRQALELEEALSDMYARCQTGG